MAMIQSRKLFVNLAVNDLPRTKAFFSKLGFTYNPQFTNDEAACMPISEEAFVMLLGRDRFKDFTKKEICDTARYTEGLFAISCDSRAEVDLNLAMTANGRIVEVQGSSEQGGGFDPARLAEMVALAGQGCRQLHDLQRKARSA